jgi:hypothetical protein
MPTVDLENVQSPGDIDKELGASQGSCDYVASIELNQSLHRKCFPGSVPVAHAVRCVVALLFLGASIMKMRAGVLESMQAFPFPVPPFFHHAIIAIEFILGLWMLSGWAAWLSTRVATGLLVLLAGVSSYQLYQGQSTCGCFGSLELNPGLVLTTDLALLASLYFFRIPAPSQDKYRSDFRWAACLCVGVVFLGAFVLVSIRFFFGDVRTLTARLRGEALFIGADVLDTGTQLRGDEKLFPIIIHNVTYEPIRIIGGSADCACVSTDDMPVTVQPGQSKAIRLRIKFRGPPGLFRQQFTILSDFNGLSSTRGGIVGRIVDQQQ